MDSHYIKLLQKNLICLKKTNEEIKNIDKFKLHDPTLRAWVLEHLKETKKLNIRNNNIYIKNAQK